MKNMARKLKKLNSMALDQKRNVPAERLPPVGELSANLTNLIENYSKSEVNAVVSFCKQKE
jgi:hypothetical protein